MPERYPPDLLRQARETIRQMLRDQGEKLCHYTAANITEAAKTLIDNDRENKTSFLEIARVKTLVVSRES